MSIEADARIRELETRVIALEGIVSQLMQLKVLVPLNGETAPREPPSIVSARETMKVRRG